MTQQAGVFTPKTDDLMQGASTQHVQVLRDFAMPFAAVIIAAAVFSGGLAAAIVANAPIGLTFALGVLFAGSAIAAIAIVRGLGYAQRVLVMIAYEFQSDHETSREIAKIQASQTNNISVKGRQNTVMVGQSQAVENTRLIPVRGMSLSGKSVDSIPVEDLSAFIDRACLVGHSKRAILGLELPSGNVVTTFEQYQMFIEPLVKSGVLVGRGERSAGRLTTNDPQAIKTLLGLTAGAEVKEIGS